MKVDTNPQKIEELLKRGVEEVIERDHLEKALKSGKKLRIYYGIDPTSSILHLGHSIVLWKLKQFQELGHDVILLIGDFTARIGDPSGKDETRKPLTEKEVKENMKTYKKQVSLILDLSKIKVKYNNEWLSKLTFEEVIKLASNFTVQRMLERDMFEKRIKEEKPIGIHEFLYPLMQGYDSVAMNVDLEIAGSDQMFNMLAGRTLQKIYNKKDKDILTTKLLIGTDGRKMSKTFGNFIPLSAPAKEMFGKIMSLRDELIEDYYELCTQTPMSEIKEIVNRLKNNLVNPRDVKAKLAEEIVKLYWGEKQAQQANEEFFRVFSEKKLPTEMPIFKTQKQNYPVLDLLKDSGLANSKQEAKRLIEGKAVEIDNQVITNWQETIQLKDDSVIKVGKKKFLRINIG